MAFWSWRRVDWRQKLKYSVHLQLTTAGQNTTPHCRSALSLTAYKLHFPLFSPSAQALDLFLYMRVAPFTHV